MTCFPPARIAGTCLLALSVIFAPAPGAARSPAPASAPARHAKEGLKLLPAIERLAQARFRSGALGEAAALRRRALAIAVAAFGAEAPQAAAAMAALAFTEIDRRRYLDAEPLLLIARGILAERAPQDGARMAAVLAGLARIALARGDTAAAEAWARRAISAPGGSASGGAGPGDAAGHATEPLRALAAVLTAERRYDEAEKLLAAALAQDRRAAGDSGGLATARTLSQLANLRLHQGRAGDALPLFEEAAALDQAGLGATHPVIADDLHDLGLAYAALQREREARRTFLAAIAVLEGGAGRDTPRLAYAELELSRLERRRGNDAAAEAAFRDARRILNKAEAEEHRRERAV